MTPNRRIFLNVVATYGRSLLALVCGLFTGRWVLMSLGSVDYGLLGLVGGLTGFVVFFNDLLSNAISRFYAVGVGMAKVDGEKGLEECRKWFNTAVTIHLLLPFALVAVGYPIGAWAIDHYLSIPVDKIADSMKVWAFVCLSCLMSMVTVPCRAYYVAKQEIAELTVYGVAQTLLNMAFVYYMVSHPGHWLVKYALWSCAIACIPNLVLAVRAMWSFPECRLNVRYMFVRENLVELGKFAFCRFWGAGASMAQSQGLPIIVNKYLGVMYNATMTVGTTVASQTLTLSQAMSGAMGPAIYNAYGAGDRKDFKSRVEQASKLGALMYLLFAIPAALEIGELLALWLKTPPPQADVLCLFVMAAYLTERLSDGQVNAIYATGRIARFQATLCVNCVIGILASWLFVSHGLGMAGIGLGIVLFKVLIMGCRVLYARKEAGLSAKKWLNEIFIPIAAASTVSAVSGFCTRLVLDASFARVVATTAVTLGVFCPLSWFFVLREAERSFVREKVMARIRSVHPRSRRQSSTELRVPCDRTKDERQAVIKGDFI